MFVCVCVCLWMYVYVCVLWSVCRYVPASVCVPAFMCACLWRSWRELEAFNSTLYHLQSTFYSPTCLQLKADLRQLWNKLLWLLSWDWLCCYVTGITTTSPNCKMIPPAFVWLVGNNWMVLSLRSTRQPAKEKETREEREENEISHILFVCLCLCKSNTFSSKNLFIVRSYTENERERERERERGVERDREWERE